MKARINFMQLPFREFINRFPSMAEYLKSQYPANVYSEFLNDSNYVVRTNGNYVEIGYLEDEWTIKQA